MYCLTKCTHCGCESTIMGDGNACHGCGEGTHRAVNREPRVQTSWCDGCGKEWPTYQLKRDMCGVFCIKCSRR